jgi:beta-lactamase class C
MNRRESIALLLAGFSSSGRLPAASSGPDAMEAAARIIQTQVEARMLESAVLHVQRRGHVFERAFGKAASPDAVFLLASITKTMTAAGVMVLADREKLRLTDRVVKFIPEFSEGARKDITIEHLLTHTSGLPDQVPDNAALRQRHAPLSVFVEHTVRTPLLFPPGTKYHYQSMGLLLAAEIVQRITQAPFPDFLAKEVFAPLGMDRTALGLGRFKMEETVRCQTEHAAPEAGAGAPDAREWDWNSAYWRALGSPWGGAHGTAADVSRFLQTFLHPAGRALREDTARLMIQNHTPNLDARRGLGFALGPAGFGKGCSDKSFGHGGSTGTLAWADPESDMTCVILTSLPASVSGNLILHPVSDVVAA